MYVPHATTHRHISKLTQKTIKTYDHTLDKTGDRPLSYPDIIRYFFFLEVTVILQVPNCPLPSVANAVT